MSQDRLLDPIAGETMPGFNALLGYRLAEWRDGHAVLELAVDERHHNRAGIVHGGVLMTMLDVTCGYSGIYSEDPAAIRRCVTLSITTTFVAPPRGPVLRAIGKRQGGGKTVYMATGEVLDADGTLCVIAQGTFRLIADAPRPA